METVTDADALNAQLNVDGERHLRDATGSERLLNHVNASETPTATVPVSSVGPVRNTTSARKEPYKAPSQRGNDATKRPKSLSLLSPSEVQDIHNESLELVADTVLREIDKFRANFAQEIEVTRNVLTEENRRLQREINQLKARTEKLEQERNKTHSGVPATHTTKATDATQGNTKPPNPPTIDKANEKRNDLTNKTFAHIASQSEDQNQAPWTQVVHRPKSKATKSAQAGPSTREPSSRRLLFPREGNAPKKEVEDIFLSINEMLKKAGTPTYVRAERVSYSAAGSISVLLKERAHTGLLLPVHRDNLIKAVKAIDPAVIGVEAIEQWHRLKVHGLSIERYGNGEEGTSLFQREIEASTDIVLKARPRWLFSSKTLLSRWMEGGRPNSTMVITVGSEKEAKILCAKGLKLGRGTKPVEKYWEQGPGTVCQVCCGIGHGKYGDCGERPPQCVICAGPHKMTDHKCKVLGCTTQAGRACIHDTVRCANCDGRHQASAMRCPAKIKAEISAKGKRQDTRTVARDASESHVMETGPSSPGTVHNDRAKASSPLTTPPNTDDDADMIYEDLNPPSSC